MMLVMIACSCVGSFWAMRATAVSEVFVCMVKVRTCMSWWVQSVFTLYAFVWSLKVGR